MELSILINKIRSDQARMAAGLPRKLRPFLLEHPVLRQRSGMVIGPRGVGKTTMLLLACVQASKHFVRNR